MRIISGIARGTKLFTLDGIQTRPTLDRVKESLFNVSRGAQKAFLCEYNREAAKIVKRNIEKTHFTDKAILIEKDYKKALQDIKEDGTKIDVVFLDPPYKTNLVYEALSNIINLEILNDDAIIIVETDNPVEIKNEIMKLNIDIYDERKYGRVSLIFLKQ